MKGVIIRPRRSPSVCSPFAMVNATFGNRAQSPVSGCETDACTGPAAPVLTPQMVQQRSAPPSDWFECNGPGHSRCLPHQTQRGASSRRPRLSPPGAALHPTGAVPHFRGRRDTRFSTVSGMRSRLQKRGVPRRSPCGKRRLFLFDINSVTISRTGALLARRTNGEPTTHWICRTAIPWPK